MANGFTKWVYKFTLARWYYNFARAWIIGYFLSTFTMIVTIYYLTPGLSSQVSFLQSSPSQAHLSSVQEWGFGKIPWTTDFRMPKMAQEPHWSLAGPTISWCLAGNGYLWKSADRWAFCGTCTKKVKSVPCV